MSQAQLCLHLMQLLLANKEKIKTYPIYLTKKINLQREKGPQARQASLLLLWGPPQTPKARESLSASVVLRKYIRLPHIRMGQCYLWKSGNKKSNALLFILRYLNIKEIFDRKNGPNQLTDSIYCIKNQRFFQTYKRMLKSQQQNNMVPMNNNLDRKKSDPIKVSC